MVDFPPTPDLLASRHNRGEKPPKEVSFRFSQQRLPLDWCDDIHLSSGSSGFAHDLMAGCVQGTRTAAAVSCEDHGLLLSMHRKLQTFEDGVAERLKRLEEHNQGCIGIMLGPVERKVTSVANTQKGVVSQIAELQGEVKGLQDTMAVLLLRMEMHDSHKIWCGKTLEDKFHMQQAACKKELVGAVAAGLGNPATHKELHELSWSLRQELGAVEKRATFGDAATRQEVQHMVGLLRRDLKLLLERDAQGARGEGGSTTTDVLWELVKDGEKNRRGLEDLAQRADRCETALNDAQCSLKRVQDELGRQSRRRRACSLPVADSEAAHRADGENRWPGDKNESKLSEIEELKQLLTAVAPHQQAKMCTAMLETIAVRLDCIEEQQHDLSAKVDLFDLHAEGERAREQDRCAQGTRALPVLEELLCHVRTKLADQLTGLEQRLAALEDTTNTSPIDTQPLPQEQAMHSQASLPAVHCGFGMCRTPDSHGIRQDALSEAKSLADSLASELRDACLMAGGEVSCCSLVTEVAASQTTACSSISTVDRPDPQQHSQ